MPIMIPVSSSNLKAVGYERIDNTLFIQFVNGGLYIYYHVPVSVYDGLMRATSHGQYFARFIKKSYSYRKLS